MGSISVSAAFLPLLAWFARPALALTLNLETAAGYDSNPAQDPDAAGLAVMHQTLDAFQPLNLAGRPLELNLAAACREYEGGAETLSQRLRLAWPRPLALGRGQLDLSLEGVRYRDTLVPEDARNEGAFILSYERILNARQTLTVTTELRDLAYLEASRPWSGRPGGRGRHSASGMTSGPAAGRHDGAVRWEPVRRDDRQLALGFDLAHRWSPDLVTGLALDALRNDSTVELEVNDRQALTLSARVGGALELALGGARTVYTRTPATLERIDREWAAGLSWQRAFRWGDGFCALRWLDHDSTIDTKRFRQRIAECGLTWSF